jgi:hypothetical protein
LLKELLGSQNPINETFWLLQMVHLRSFDNSLIRVTEVLTFDPSTRSLCELAQGDVRARVVGRGGSKVALRATFELFL